MPRGNRTKPSGTNGTLVLDLSRHCIETAAVHAYRSLVDAFVGHSGRDPNMEEKLVLVHAFLQTSDFAKLRAEHPELAGGSAIRIRLQRSNSGGVTWNVVV